MAVQTRSAGAAKPPEVEHKMLPAPTTPLADIYETPDELVVEVEVPGFDLTNLELSVLEHTVTVNGSREPPGLECHFLTHERGSHNFRRKFNLPAGVDASRLRATLVHGVLTLRAPRIQPEQAPHHLEIEEATGQRDGRPS